MSPASVVVETGGIGYLCKISLAAYERLQTGAEVKLLIHHHFREDAQTLFGFLEAEEQAVFEALLGVSGVGGNMALTILSSISAAELREAVAAQNTERLRQVKGVGKKTAERLALELKDKLDLPEAAAAIPVGSHNNSYSEALKALINLGFPRQEAEKKLRAAREHSVGAAASAEELIKFALQN